jgi:hypothetical protein
MSIKSGALPPQPLDPEALHGKPLSMKTDAVMERLALLFVVNCFRNTVLEKYHTEWPEFTQAKMKALMKEAVDKLHTALHAIFTGDEATRDAAWAVLDSNYQGGWDAPEFNQSMLRAIELAKKARKRDRKKSTNKTRSRIPAGQKKSGHRSG